MAHKTEWLMLNEMAMANAVPNDVPWIKMSLVARMLVFLCDPRFEDIPIV